ncbi:MAG: 23S rRNA (guanosine(2251)-2'-O)-methyltransferase RlmB [bacterium]
MKKEKIYIYGKHALMEALLNCPQAIDKVFLSLRGDLELEKIIKDKNIAIGTLNSAEVEKDAVHQGVIAKINLDKLLIKYEDFIKTTQISSKISFVFLGGLHDPHNVGAIIRSAAAFGISGVLIPKKEQAPITGAVAKVSAGMLFRIPIIEVKNSIETIKDLKNREFSIYGLEGTSNNYLDKEVFNTPTVFVMGNESRGLDKDIEELCTKKIAIPMNKRCESLNVAVSASVTFYEWSKNHKDSLKD